MDTINVIEIRVYCLSVDHPHHRQDLLERLLGILPLPPALESGPEIAFLAERIALSSPAGAVAVANLIGRHADHVRSGAIDAEYEERLNDRIEHMFRVMPDLEVQPEPGWQDRVMAQIERAQAAESRPSLWRRLLAWLRWGSR